MKIRCNGCFGEYDVRFQICPHCGYVAGSPAAEVYCLSPGVELMGRYTVGNVIGLGGFGIIYKAWDMKLETVIAIKEFFPTRLVKRNADGRSVSLLSGRKEKEFEHSLERFLKEAENLALFNRHPNIVNLYEYFEHGGTAYIVMEYLDGINLDQYIQRLGAPPDHGTATEIALCVCSAVRDIHAQKILHRDISPENIIVCRNGMIKVIDLGAAYFGQSDITPDDVVVKPGYAPPEQYDMVSTQGPEVDVYSIGAVMYSLLTGVRPVESTDRKEDDPLVPPSQLNGDVPAGIDGIVMKAMAVDRRFRYRSVNQLIKALADGKSPATTGQQILLRRILGYVAVGVVCALMAAVALLVVLRSTGPVTYPERTITMWYVEDGDISADGLTQMLEDFAEAHPEVTVDAVPVASWEYADCFGQAVLDGEVPDVFDSTYLPDYKDEFAAGVVDELAVNTEELMGGIGSGDGLFTGRAVPMGFASPVVYVNTALVEAPDDGIDSVAELMELCDSANSEFKACAVDEFASFMYREMFGWDLWSDFCFEYEMGTRDGFISGELPVYIADSTEYNRLLREMPGLFKPVGITAQNVCCRYNSVWSVSADCDEEERECALGLLSFMLSDAGQDTLHIINPGRSIPIKKGAYDEFRKVYIELGSTLDTEAALSFFCVSDEWYWETVSGADVSSTDWEDYDSGSLSSSDAINDGFEMLGVDMLVSNTDG